MLHTVGMKCLNYKELLKYLKRVDKSFPTQLSEKVDISEYAKKIYETATICFKEINGEIIGIVGGYTENVINNVAFISIVSVLPEFSGRGIATNLLNEFVSIANSKGLNSVHLYAEKRNKVALHLYQSFGFIDSYFENDIRPKDIHFYLYLQQKTVLITAIGSFSADIVIKNMKMNGFKVVGSDIYPSELIVDSYNVNNFYRVPLAINENDYLEAIDKICQIENVTHIIPLTDVEIDFYNKYRNYFEARNIVLCMSPSNAIELCRDKKKQQEFIDREVKCVNTIQTKYVTDCEEIPFKFPMICKPYNGRSSQGIKHINTYEDWHILKKYENIEKYIVQPFIKGNIVTVDVVRERNGANAVAIPRLEFLRTQNGAGTSVKVFSDPNLEKCCIELANKLGVIGCVNFEFIKSEKGKYYFVECNPRFSGGIEFSCLAGYDCITNHIKAFENKEIESYKMVHETYIARKYEEYITSIVEVEE